MVARHAYDTQNIPLVTFFKTGAARLVRRMGSQISFSLWNNERYYYSKLHDIELLFRIQASQETQDIP